MAADPNNPAEAWGVLNPATARVDDECVYLYPRAVAEGNYSRIERTTVVWRDGHPAGVVREGFALEPSEQHELHPRSLAGVEDPRVTYLRPLGLFVMAYVALSRLGPRIALAVSKDGRDWDRLGPLRFRKEAGVDFGAYGNKDAAFFPDVIFDPQGRPALAVLHRPTYLVARSDGRVERRLPPGIGDERGSIWMSYISLEDAVADPAALVRAYHSTLLAGPEAPWEALKIGGGCPPLLTSEGWVLYYHGVSGSEGTDDSHKDVTYQAGVMVLDRDDPREVKFRSANPVLSPFGEHEESGIVPNVVFPTAIDCVGQRIFVFYGAADSRIAVATTQLHTEILVAPSTGPETARSSP